MSTLNELIGQIENPELRQRIADEVKKLNKQKKFGLVFEEHLPECTPLYDIPIRKNSKVAKYNDKQIPDLQTIYTVLKVEGDRAICIAKDINEAQSIELCNLVCIAEFGEAIYPYLKPIDSVCNAPNSDLWHTLIEADNYHALQLLEYLYTGKVDCIYIDPPYNKEDSKDWAYNCNYVDSNDAYRHSKWLSMMEKRLKIAKKLLNPSDSILIVTIDETEYLHLGCLLEELFPDAKMQMISSVINRAGTGRKYEFSRTDEYLFFLRFGSACIAMEKIKSTDVPVTWDTLRRSGPTNTWNKTKRQFYPVFVEDKTKKIHSIGEPLIYGQDKIEDVVPPKGCTAVFPIRDNGLEMMWGCVGEEFVERLKKGYIRVGKYTPQKPQKYVISYLTSGIISDIENGNAVVKSVLDDGSVDAYYVENKEIPPTTNWQKPTHDSQWYGSNVIKPILGNRFPYPKSIFAVKDCLKYCVQDKPEALILDFFAGSGTTLHAVNLLNAEDGGHRRCIMITNNEVNKEDTRNELKARNIYPGDEEWEKLGIARYITWPRTVCSIKGTSVDGISLDGNYGAEIEDFVKIEDGEHKGFFKKVKLPVYESLAKIKVSDGFKANAAFFKLGFLDKTKVSLGMQFKEMLPTLWMKAGAIGECPSLNGKAVPEMLVLPKNKMAVLNDENQFAAFAEELSKYPEIGTVYLVTDYEGSFVSMTNDLPGKTTYQLYRDYLDNFRINAGRNAR